MKYSYDIAILGAGSGGLVVASAAAGMGARVLLVENNKMGGDCLNYGCVPSKTFLKSTHLAKSQKNSHRYGLESTGFQVSIKSIMDRVRSVIKEIEPHDSKERFEALGVDVVFGNGRVSSQNSLIVDGKEYTTKRIVIATGSTAAVRPITGLDQVPFYTNETIFDLDYLPKNLVVLGGGPIGLELGQGFSNLGSDVSIIDRSTSLFSKDEPEVAPILEKVLTEDGVNLYLKSEILEVTNNEVIITQYGKEKIIPFDTLLVSLGRVPNTSNLGLEDVGVKLDKKGFIITDKKLRTNVKSIYACGDVTGGHLFTHSASYEAGIVVRNALIGPFSNKANYHMAWTTYTSPGVAHVGCLEAEAKKDGIFGNSLMLGIAANDRSKAEDDRDGFVKVVLDKKRRLIGATIVSEVAGEMLPIFSLMVTQKQKLSKVMSIIYQYPIQGEILKSLALMDFKASVKPWQTNLIRKIVRR